MSVGTATAKAPPPRSWIVSPWWDLAYIVVTPLLIVPIVLIVARHWVSAEQISLAAIAFASLGHHLPGFMRAYGDRELFLRYRTRFLLVPPLVFAMALLFTPPSGLRAALGLPWQHLHGLELILLIWGTWHGLMQTYGFMRIYDLRKGHHHPLSARLDHALCLAVFTAGVVFSDARVFGIADAMWQSGLPPFGPEWLGSLRVLVGSAGICVLGAYVIHQALLWRQGQPLAWIKWLLIGTTGWFYWYTGRLSTNLLIGLAMFEIYHAVQYNAIVWIYNRRLFRRAREKFGPLGFLFRDGWTMLGVYLGAIVAYSSLRYFTLDSDTYLFRGGGDDLFQWLVALFVTSAFLHFYFDGFIWKVSERHTQENLIDQGADSSLGERVVPGLIHSAKWAVLFSIAALLLASESLQLDNRETSRQQRLAALAELTPDLPECQALLSQAALARGNAPQAIEHAERAVALRPRSHTMIADLALGQMMAGKLEQAEGSFRRAIAIAPNEWQYYRDLAMLHAGRGEISAAENTLQQAVQVRPDLAEPRQQLAEFYLGLGRADEAAHVLERILVEFPDTTAARLGEVALAALRKDYQAARINAQALTQTDPGNWKAWLSLGSVYNSLGQGEDALAALREADRLRPNNASVQLQLGLAHFEQEELLEADAAFRRVIELEPGNYLAHLQMANLHYSLGRISQAIHWFHKCFQLRPDDAQVSANLGGLLVQMGKTSRAEAIYREGLAENPDSAQLNYNLGVLLWQRGDREEARRRILLAEKMGMELSPAVRAALEEDARQANTTP